MTYDAGGTATTGKWDTIAVLKRRWSTNGLPYKSFVTCGSDTTCWKPEFYEWGTGGVLTKKTYNNDASAYKNFVTQYDYHTGTRLVSKITAVDGQSTEYTYDKLQRLSNVKTRKTGTSTYNVQTDYTYQYKNASNPRSYVKTRTTFTATAGSSLTEKILWQYLDGLGRPVQTIDQKHSPGQKDVVSTITYDNQGRQDSAFVVYESTVSPFNTGAFVAAIPANTPYTLTQYFADPLNRPSSVKPPAWYATTYAYGANVANNVKLDHAGGTFYAVNNLYRTTINDPNGNQSSTFKDKKGRLVLSRRHNPGGSTTNADTYNLYDNKDRLTTVIPPDAIISNTNLIFKYLYDAADNMTSKDVPDAAAMTMKYNRRNLMTMMQHGNLLAFPNNWLCTNYDIYGRPIATGFKATTITTPDSTFWFSNTNKLTETTYDDVASGSVIYKGKVKQGKVKIMDNANNSFLTTDFTYDAHGRVSTTSANNFTGGTDSYTFVYDWADNRLTSTRNHKRVTSDPSFTTIVEKTGYDHAGRLTSNKHNLNSAATDTYLSSLSYNYKDQLLEKNLGIGSIGTLQSLDYTYNAQGWLRTINGPTLGGANTALAACPTSSTAPNPGAAGSATFNPDPNDLFYLELRYDSLFSNMAGSAQFNGNIAQAQWRSRGRQRQGYSFTYDLYDRLTAANYFDIDDGGTTTASNRFNESLTYTDKRGNIATLNRRGAKFNTTSTCWDFDVIDNLTYAYTAGTNKISTISDGAAAVWKDKGFKDGSASSYVYDVNGNMTTDPDKGMTVQYNHLNLPKKFTFGTNTIDILYDAAGNKLKKTVAGTTNYTQDYIGGIEYRGTTREAIYTAEGRIRYISGKPRYEYTIKDHLGNARISFCDLDSNKVVNLTNVVATNEILQENHYYPFGLNTEGPWMNDENLDNKYQYNGKEINDDFGLNLNDYGARWYDAAGVTWWGIDPLADEFTEWSPYNYAVRNPVNFTDPDGRNATNEYVKDFKTGEVKQVGTKGGDQTDYVYSGQIKDGGATVYYSPTDPEVLQVEQSSGEVALRMPGVNRDAGTSPAIPTTASPVDGAVFAAGKAPGLILKLLSSISSNSADEAGNTAPSSNATTPYKRPNNATTPAQRKSVQGKPCVDCGKTSERMVADHKKELVKEYHETGTIDKVKMRQVESVQPQCPSCSVKQGARMSKYSKEQNKNLNGGN